jgi:hypothetical protein
VRLPLGDLAVLGKRELGQCGPLLAPNATTSIQSMHEIPRVAAPRNVCFGSEADVQRSPSSSAG